MDRNSQHYNYLRSHLMRSRWYRVFIAAAAIVVFITTYMLILPAITLDAKCGKEEHKHTETCYQVSNKLTCTKEETPGHTHTEACYQTTDIISCGLEESDPVVEEIVNEETGEIETVVVSEGHTHNANCYTQETNLICGQEECEAHTHAKDCYKEAKKLTCDKEEHKHTENCYHEQSDPNADLENEAIWTQTFAHLQLTGNWSEDVAAIAKTQVGYKESAKNFIYDKDDEKDGYTRYGAWYGDPYGEWCAMFSSFCIHYAGVGYDANNVAFPLEANCANWINKLQQVGYYHDAGNSLYMDQLGREAYTGNDYFVKPGDLIFFNLKNSQNVVSDHVGIVTDVTERRISTIQGNSNYSVVEKDYSVGDVTIVGFGEIPENPNYVDPDKQGETKPEEATAESGSTTKKKASKIQSSSKEDKADESSEEAFAAARTFGIAPLSLSDEDGIAPYSDGTATDMKNYVTNITISKDNGGKWQASDQFQDGERVRMDMAFDVPANVVTKDNPSIYYTFPKGLLAPGTDMTGNVYDHGVVVGTYEITTADDGEAVIVITYNNDFADGNAFTGTAFFTAEIALGEGQSQHEYAFDGTNTKITVNGKEQPYDIKTNKSATKGSDGKSVDYVVDISTTDGTDGPVIVSDAVYQGWNGEDVGPATYKGTVTVEKYGADSQKIQGADTTFQVSGNKFEQELPELQAGQSYKIKYSVDVHDSYAADDGTFKITNYANGKLKDHPYTNQGAYTETEISKTKITKYGNYNQITGQMDFTITINNPDGVDLGNREVVDVVTTQGIELIDHPFVTDAAGNVVSGGIYTDGDGKLFSYKFPSGSTATTYYIKYSTSAPAENGATVENKATYKGDGEREYHASSNPSVNHRAFGFNKSTRGQWVDDQGVDKFEWQTYMTLPDGQFPQNGYFYEDTIKDATQGNSTYPDTHYGTKSEIESKIHETFKLNVIEDGQTVEKDWNAATGEFVDVEIKCYTEKDGQEVTADSTQVKYFTVQVTPKNGKTFSASNMYFNYITSGNRNGFTDGRYYFANDGAVGNDHSTPGTNVDMGDINPNKTYKGVSSDGEKVEWQASIDLPKSGLPVAGHLFEDQMEDAKDETGTSYPGTHYGTVSEITAKIQETFAIKIGNETKNWSEAQSLVNVVMKFYKQENGQNIETISDDDHVTYFTVQVTPKSGQTVMATNVTFNYQTHVNQNGINGGFMKYSNTLKVNGKENTTTYTKRIMASLEKSVYTGNAGAWDKNGTLTNYVYSSKDGKEISYENGTVTYRILVNTGAGAENDHQITIADNIPEGMEYVEGSAYITQVGFYNMDQETFSTAQSNFESTIVQYNVDGVGTKYFELNNLLSATCENGTLSLNVSEGYTCTGQEYVDDQWNPGMKDRNGSQYTGYLCLYYTLHITDPVWNNPTTLKKTYVNNATWEQTGHGDSLETKVVRPVEEVKKLATPVKDAEGHINAINYNVTINPAAEDLNPESHVLELEDTMNPGMGTATMVLESIRLYAYDASKEDHIGAAIDTNRYQYHYDANAKKLNITIPDELACVLQYTYEVSSGQASKDYEVSNKVSLMGKDYDSNKVTMKNQESGVTSTKSKILLYKVDKDNYGKRLAGVKFELRYLDSNGTWTLYSPDEGATSTATDGIVVTNENGQILFDNSDTEDLDVPTMHQNTLYRIVEKENPNSGYAVDDTPHYLVWLDGATTADAWYDSSTYKHGNVPKDQIQFFEHKGASIYIENEYKAISVKKAWVDEDGTDILNPPSNITVKLYESTREKDIVTVNVVFKSNDGTELSSKSINVARQSGLTISGWGQEYPSTISVSDGATYTVDNNIAGENQYNLHRGTTINLSNIADNVTVIIKGGTGEGYEYGYWDINNNWQTYAEMSWGGWTLRSDEDGKEYPNVKNPNTGAFDFTIHVTHVTKVLPGVLSADNVQFSNYTSEDDAEYVTGEGTVVDTVTLDSSNNWSHTWGEDPNDKTLKLNRYYYVEEVAIAGTEPYQTDYTVLYQNNNGIMTGEILITNRIPKQEIEPEKKTISIEKKWIDPTNHELSGDALQGKQAYFRLMQVVNGNVDAATEYTTFTLPENNSWSKTFDNLNKTTYDSQGNATHYKYYFEEISSTGTTEPTYQKESIWNFLPWVNGSENAEKTLIDEGSVTVTNKLLPEKTTVSVEKKWLKADGSEDTTKYDSDASVTVDLYKIDNGGQGVAFESGITLNKGNSWKYENAELIKEEYKDGVKHTYSYYFVETNVSGYQTSYKTVDGQEVTTPETIAINVGTVTVINKQQLKDSVTVNKQWFKSVNGNTTQIDDKTGSISFDLYRLATKTGGDEPVDPVDPGETTCEHSWGEWIPTKPATETEAGEQKRTCSKCPEEETQSISPTGHTHDYDDGPVTTAATFTSTGVRTFTCSGCGDTYTQEVPVDSANHTGGTYTSGYVAPTTTTAGKEADTYCKGCNVKIADGAVIPATGGGGSSDPVLVEFHQDWSGGTLWAQGNVIPNKPAALTVTFVGITNYTPDLVVNGTNASKSAEYINSENQKCVDYTFTFTVDSATTYILGFGAEWTSLVNWNVSNVSTRAATSASARSLMSAPRLASAPTSETPTIPTDAVYVGTFQIHSDSGWTFTKEFDAEPGYTYTYYVVETGNDNLTTTYVGEGTNNITIKNTIVENSYELPHTGGRGTKLITMLGILLMAAASSLMILKKHRKEEIW